MAREVVRIFQVASTWMVTYRFGQESHRFSSRKEAEAFAKTIAKQRRPSVLVLMNQESIVEYELEF